MENIMLPKPHRVLSVQKETKAEYTFRVAYDGTPRHGQFFMLSIPCLLYTSLCKVVVCDGLDLRPGYAKASDDDPRKDHHRKQGAEHTLEHLLPLIQISFPSYLNGRM